MSTIHNTLDIGDIRSLEHETDPARREALVARLVCALTREEVISAIYAKEIRVLEFVKAGIRHTTVSPHRPGRWPCCREPYNPAIVDYYFYADAHGFVESSIDFTYDEYADLEITDGSYMVCTHCSEPVGLPAMWGDKVDANTRVHDRDARAIIFDFAPRMHSGMFSAMYRIGCGTMYYGDIDHVEDELNEQLEEWREHADPDNGEDLDWRDTLMLVEDEIRTLKRHLDASTQETP